MFPVLHPGQKLIFAEYLEYIASALAGVASGKYKRLLINLPPRHMKSVLTSVLYPAWCLGRNPAAKFICISYSDDLSNLTRKVMRSPEYQLIFPNTHLDKLASDYIRTGQGGYRFATAVGSHITGFGADVIIIDDPIQPADAASENVKRNVRDWVANSVLTRFNNPNLGALILVMHRVAPDDLSGTMEASADLIIKLPLVADKDEGPMGHKGRIIYRRRQGEPLNPRILNLEAIEKLKVSMPPHVFASQYQQRPTVGGSGMLSIEKFHRYDPATPPLYSSCSCTRGTG